MPEWWNGRHATLKMWYPKGCVSSSLTSGTDRVGEHHPDNDS